jgi:hypothetical protein
MSAVLPTHLTDYYYWVTRTTHPPSLSEPLSLVLALIMVFSTAAMAALSCSLEQENFTPLSGAWQ